MNIYNFLPKYPNIVKSNENILNPYDDGFYESIFRKKEFYDERLSPEEDLPDERGSMMKHQKIITRFLSSHTMYDSLLLVHEMGSGKTCTAIGAIEQIKNETNNFKGALIFAKGKGLVQNFIKELRDKCTAGQYIPEGFVDKSIGGCGAQIKNKGLTDIEANIRTKKLIQDFYSTGTFETFAKHIHKTKDSDIISFYSNRIIVIDEVHNLRIQDVTEDGKISMYEEFKRFLHLVKNCKIILLSGTPMKDSPSEIASVMNLILPYELQLPTGESFNTKYLDNHGENNYTVKKNRIKSLKKRLKGRISFLKSIRSKVKKEFTGEKNVGKLNHLIVEQIKMSKFQTQHYNKAVALDQKGKAGVHYNSRQASLMVFPDGTYGQPRITGTKNIDRTKGFAKYVKSNTKTNTFTASKLKGEKVKNKTSIITYKLNKELIDAIVGDTSNQVLDVLKPESTKYKEIIKTRLKNLQKFSSKYAQVIKSILNATNESCFVYSELVSGSGAIIFTLLLKLFGFSPSTGSDTKPGLRYGFLTSNATSSQIHKIINCFNQPDNMHGKIIKVLIGSKVISEGVSFYNVQREYILTPWYNYSETDQAIARGYRLNSHKALLENGETPIVRISQLVSIPRKGGFSIDLDMYETSEIKDITIRGILRYMMEASFDCSLNYFRNHITGEDGKRGCDYQSCNYVCDGVNMKNIEDGLPIDEIDTSTYELYYTDPKILPIRKDLEKYFRKHNELDINNVVKYFDNKYSEWEIKNALKIIINKSEENMFYKDYINIYSKSTAKIIMIGISELFSKQFRISFSTMKQTFPNNTEFEILTSLKNIVDESIVIKNKYGFSSYLREDQNIYFLVNSISINNDSFSDYYSRIPNIITNKTFSDILYDVQIEHLPLFIKMLCKIKKNESFTKLIKSIPEEVQELFIEAAVQAEHKNIDSNQITRKLVLEYFVNYIHTINDDLTISNKLSDGEVLRCFKNNIWINCGKEYKGVIEEKLKTRKSTLEQNPWGYYGQRNPETGVFSIVNVFTQKEKQRIVKEKETKKLDALVKNGKISGEERNEILIGFIAGRELYPGRNCRQGWGVPLLIKIAVKTLKLDYPATFKKNDNNENMRKLISNDRYLGKGTSKNIPVYNKKEIEELTNDDLRRSLYWVTKQTGGYINGLCTAIEKWFRKTKWKGMDMLIPDKQAGTSGGHIKLSNTDKTPKKQVLRVEKVIPEQNEVKFKTYLKDIQKLMNDCFKVKNYTPEIDSKQWVMVFSRKKIVGFIVIDDKNIIWNTCIATNYRRRGMGKQAIEIAVSEVCPKNNPRLKVDNLGKNYKKLISLYTSYGFTIVKNDQKITEMEFKCS
jgi:superfamily II DNA or RNA helicase